MNKKLLPIIFCLFSVVFIHAKKALIFGVTGQDGSYLLEFLLDKGYEVHGVRRRASTSNTGRINHLLDNPSFELHYGDVTDVAGVFSLVCSTQPDEIYNFAAQSHVKVSFELPSHTAQVDAVGVLNILEAVRLSGCTDSTRVYQASTSELFGKVHEVPQSETTPFYPRSPYGVAKLYGFWITKNYREAWNIFACNGILFNHESPRRGDHFVTKKIARVAARIAYGLEGVLYLGNLDAKRDWGHTRDYVKAMWMILQQDEPDDYVIATGEAHSVREFVEHAFALVGMPIEWRGVGVDEIGVNAKTGDIVVRVNPDFFRPTEVDLLLGDPTKAYKKLGWQSTTSFEALVKEMVEYECMLSAKERELRLLVEQGTLVEV